MIFPHILASKGCPDLLSMLIVNDADALTCELSIECLMEWQLRLKGLPAITRCKQTYVLAGVLLFQHCEPR